jgi:hypothetical protein
VKPNFVLLPLLLAAGVAHAAPMGFRGSWMSMGEFSADYRELTVNRALTRADAVGATALQMRSQDGTRALDNQELTYTRLLRRWNLPSAQANAWFIGGIGQTTERGRPEAVATLSPGLQLDYETTRVYSAVYARAYRGEGLSHRVLAARAGFSFYETDYDEVQPWLIVEARRMSYLSDATELTPMLRLIHKSFFVEAGANTEGRPRFNFMYIF